MSGIIKKKFNRCRLISLLFVPILLLSIGLVAFSPIFLAFSAQRPIDVQAPDSTHFGKPFKIEVTINDPVIKQFTNTIVLDSTTGWYTKLGAVEISGAKLKDPVIIY
ncbi:MAG: hypothetical protein QXK35_03710 [Nitrososphaerales archaeon]